LLGHWKNFDELESSLSIDELNAILNASREKQERDMKFQAAINGIDVDGEKQEEVPQDISVLQNSRLASQEGFGVGEGLGFLKL
jgi:hypothetical protein